MKRKSRPDAYVLIGLILLGILLGRLQTSARAQGRTDPVTAAARTAIRPAAIAFSSIGNGVSGFGAALTRGRALQEENDRLRAIAAAAANYQSDIDRLQLELEQVRKLAGWKEQGGRSKVPATIIGFFPQESRLQLDVGSSKGIRKGMPVATYDGVIGRVETVDRGTSQVLLLTSQEEGSRITALVDRPRPNPPVAGLLRGGGSNSLILELTDPTATVQMGDRVITSGFSSVIPRGLVIGKVVSIEDDPAFGKRNAVIFPAVAIGEVREVFVIR